MRGALLSWLGLGGSAAALQSVQSSALPAVLVFENARYQQHLASIVAPGTLDIIDCSNSSVNNGCNPPPAEIADRVAVVVSALPRNTSLFPALPKLKLFHSSFYVALGLPAVIKPETVGICFYLPYEFENRSSIEDAVDPMAEWATLVVLEWQYKLAEKEAVFRRCAFAENAPLDCPVFSSLTSHPTLWRSKTTVGIMGFGGVGKAMADHFHRLGVRVIATDLAGPYSPLPDGLSWFGPDNDHLLRTADFVIVAVSDSVPDIINKTSLALMKPGAVLIPLDPTNVDFDALYDALEGNAIGGAILDVWPDGCWGFKLECGPPFGPGTRPYAGKGGRGSFRDLPNVRMTPNVMFQFEQFWDNSAAFCGANLNALVRGQPLDGVVRNITTALAPPVLLLRTADSGSTDTDADDSTDTDTNTCQTRHSEAACWKGNCTWCECVDLPPACFAFSEAAALPPSAGYLCHNRTEAKAA